MATDWLEVYKELTDFVAAHPEIELRPDMISIPGDVRPKFYHLFNKTRGAFIEDKHAETLAEARTLSREYKRAEADIMKQLGVTNINPSAALGWFLHDPVDGLQRDLFDPLFYLLKGRVNISDELKANVDVEGFEQGASSRIENNFREFYYAGYEKWVVLSLLKLLEADRVFGLPKRPITHGDRSLLPAESDEVPPPEETKAISLDHSDDQRLLTADFIIHSARMNNFISMRTEMFKWGTGLAITSARNPGEKRERLDLLDMGGLGSGLTLVYMDDNPEEISLVADIKRLCRPDMVLAYRCKSHRNWLEKQRWGWIKQYHDILRPRLGTTIVSLSTEVEIGSPEPAHPGIEVIMAGYDSAKLTEIVLKLQAASAPGG